MNNIDATISNTGLPGFTLVSPTKLERLATDIATETEPAFEQYLAVGEEIEQAKRDIAESSRHIEEMEKNVEAAKSDLKGLHTQNEDLIKLKAALMKGRVAQMQKLEFLESELAKSNQRIADGQARIALGLQQVVLLEKLRLEAAEHGQRADEADKKAAQGKENVAKLRAEIAAERAEIAAEREEAARLRASGTEKLIIGICRHFSRAFHGAGAPELSKEDVSALSSKYFPKTELVVERDPDTQKPVILVNDSTPFVEYSRANPTLLKCTLTAFTIRERRNIQAFADYLALPDCPITTLTINIKFPLEVRQCLNAAKAQRKGALKICVPPPASVPKPPVTASSVSSSSSSSAD